MADNKKSVILYCDVIHTFEVLEDDEAGRLIKHFLRYVNDLNPVAPDKLTQIAFEPIKQQLKRDLIKWEDKKDIKSISGHLGGIKSGEVRRKQKEANEANASKLKQKEANEAVTVNVTVNDNVNVIEKQQQEFQNLFLIDQTLLEHTCRITHCTDSGFKEIVKDFFSENTAAKKIWLDLHDCNKHFISWLRYYKPKDNVVIYKKTKINPVHE